MKVRYTASGARDFDEAINNLLERSPHVVADFANDIEMAIDRLLEHPYSAQETKKPGVYRKYVRRFQYSIFYAVDEEATEIVILHIRHAARSWPWQE